MKRSNLILNAFMVGLLVAIVFSFGCNDDATSKPTHATQPVVETDSVADSSIYVRRYGRTLVYYAFVDKAGDYSRRMFIDSLSASVFTKNGSLPEDALIYLETWFGNTQSTTYIRQKKQGQWLSGSFSPASPAYNLELTASCNNCHATAQTTDNTFTLPLLRKAMQRHAVQWIECPEYSFNPCDLGVYQGN